MTALDDGARWEQARRRAQQLRHFYIHVLAFAIGNVVAFFINWMTLGDGADSWWFQWGLLVWAAALAVHALTLAGRGAFLGPGWEQRKIDQYLRADDQTTKPTAISSTARETMEMHRQAVPQSPGNR
jgi:hypothetical protein